jgi:hypothetical protein
MGEVPARFEIRFEISSDIIVEQVSNIRSGQLRDATCHDIASGTTC